MMEIRRRPLGALVIAGIAAALAGCAAERLHEEQLEREARINVYPASYRADLVGAMHAYVSDPASIRDAWVAEPAVVDIGRGRRYAACMRFSARGSDGRYASREALAVFADGRFDQFIEAAASTDPVSQARVAAMVKEQCEAADYKRFLELEAMKR